MAYDPSVPPSPIVTQPNTGEGGGRYRGAGRGGGLRRRRCWQQRLTAPENGRSGDDHGEGGRPWRDADCGGAGKRKGEGRRRRWSGQWSESEGNREEAVALGNRGGGRRISAEEMEAAVEGGRGRVTGEGRQSADGGGVGEGGDGGWGGEIRKWRWRSATQAVVGGDREVNGGEGAVMGSRRRKRRKGEGAEEKHRRSARLRWRRQGAERKRK